MAILPVRLFGLLLLTLTIGITSCQSLFPLDGGTASQPWDGPEVAGD